MPHEVKRDRPLIGYKANDVGFYCKEETDAMLDAQDAELATLRAERDQMCEAMKWLRSEEATLRPHREATDDDGGYAIWWNVEPRGKRGKSLSGHPLASPEAALLEGYRMHVAEGLQAERDAASLAPKQSGVEMIAAERERQVSSEGFTPEHDDWFNSGQTASLTRASMAYADVTRKQLLGATQEYAFCHSAAYWPWDSGWWKPSSDPIRNLVKAGALIAAEIDRLKRQIEEAQCQTK
jgi:hypothetical protein